LDQGDTAQAVRWVQESGLGVDDEFELENALNYEGLARVLIVQGQSDPNRLDDALRLLARLLEMAEQAGAMHLVVRILTLQATALAQAPANRDKIDQALAVLKQALDIAEPEGYIRTFVDGGERISQLLLRVLSQRSSKQQTTRTGAATDYVDKLLSAFREKPNRLSLQAKELRPFSLVEPLSERELEVLRLVAAGFSNREIAQSLVIAVNTVKNHLKNIYGKLNAHNRTQAVDRARSLDLL